MEEILEPTTKILLVEDDPMIQEMYKFRLEAENYQVYITDKGSEALEYAEREKPSIVLLDIILPETDGLSILQTLKSNPETASIPVLLLTNLGQESDRDRGREMGAADYFVKAEHTPSDVIYKIQQILLEQ
ncbi:MAG: response regulator [Candidatus Buchananbacteria bacterium]|nr:response regulator [Candidatus Buchananbacteria bacterium]